MSSKGNAYLVADAVVLLQQQPETPAWIVYDQKRRRFVVEPESQAGRLRTQVGPYPLTVSVWQMMQDVDTAVSDLRKRLMLRG